jgi:spore cortex biosynthesis protein YabQ
MMICGAGLGFFLDFYRIMARECWLIRKTRHLLDVLYWLVATFTILLILYKSNGMQIRPITFVAILIGMIIYYGTVSSIFVPIMHKSIRMVKSIVQFFGNIINACLIRPFWLFCRFLIATSIFLCKLVLQLIHSIWQRFRLKE